MVLPAARFWAFNDTNKVSSTRPADSVMIDGEDMYAQRTGQGQRTPDDNRELRVDFEYRAGNRDWGSGQLLAV